jgi:hypothetical protein
MDARQKGAQQLSLAPSLRELPWRTTPLICSLSMVRRILAKAMATLQRGCPRELVILDYLISYLLGEQKSPSLMGGDSGVE